jgi:hypothetical protein
MYTVPQGSSPPPPPASVRGSLPVAVVAADSKKLGLEEAVITVYMEEVREGN